MKKLHLHKTALSRDAIKAIAEKTLRAGGFNPAAVQPTEPEIGTVMDDGTVYAGPSPTTGNPMYAIPADAPLPMTFNHAAEYAKETSNRMAYGHADWRVPSKAELNFLFNHRAAIGGFNVTGSRPSDWYWSSSSRGRWRAWASALAAAIRASTISITARPCVWHAPREKPVL